jgi:hypothetical protein
LVIGTARINIAVRWTLKMIEIALGVLVGEPDDKNKPQRFK